VYIKEYGTLPDARAGLTEYFQRYNSARPHQALDYKTPNEVYFSPNWDSGLPPERGVIFLKSVV
jgi:transposase InsO family protein